MSDPLIISTLLILTQREHARLNTQIKRLQRYDLDADDLLEYKDNWEQRLGFHRHISLLIQSVDNLIDALQQGDFDESLYDDVALYLRLYQKTCWAVMERVYGSLSEYLDQRKQVKAKYKQQFTTRYEGFEKLSIDNQTELMRTIISSINVSHFMNPPN